MAFPPTVQRIADAIRLELHVATPFLLEEQNPTGRHQPVEIREARGQADALVVSFDQCFSRLSRTGNVAEWLFPLFREGEGLRRSCDYLVFYERDQNLWVLLFELKSRTSEGARDQLASTRLLADYLLSVARHHGAPDDVQRRYRGIILKESARPLKVGPKATVSYPLVHPSMADLPFAVLHPQKFWLLDAFCS